MDQGLGISLVEVQWHFWEGGYDIKSNSFRWTPTLLDLVTHVY